MVAESGLKLLEPRCLLLWKADVQKAKTQTLRDEVESIQNILAKKIVVTVRQKKWQMLTKLLFELNIQYVGVVRKVMKDIFGQYSR